MACTVNDCDKVIRAAIEAAPDGAFNNIEDDIMDILEEEGLTPKQIAQKIWNTLKNLIS